MRRTCPVRRVAQLWDDGDENARTRPSAIVYAALDLDFARAYSGGVESRGIPKSRWVSESGGIDSPFGG